MLGRHDIRRTLCYYLIMSFIPSYKALYESGELLERVDALNNRLKRCNVCPRNCAVDRTAGRRGFCRVGGKAVVSSFAPHFGEEAVLSGTGGSGTIFMSYCNAVCAFCQNYEISQLGEGRREVETEELSEMMIELQRMGCHNINFVTPSHQVPQIVAALPGAVELGLEIPLVYNTNSYDTVATLALLEGIFDIYLPDLKYSDDMMAMTFSKTPSYVAISRAAVVEMHRQVGDLEVDERGIAERGMIVRHLVLPDDIAGTDDLLDFIADELSPDTYLNIMDQYRPSYMSAGKESLYPELGRPITDEEFDRAVTSARSRGITRLAHINP